MKSNDTQEISVTPPGSNKTIDMDDSAVEEKRPNTYTHENSSVISTKSDSEQNDSTNEPHVNTDVGGITCRICGEGESDGKMIAPCNGCDDSEKYIKVSCFKEWFENDDDFWKLQCPKCGGNFDGPEVVEIANKFFEKMMRGECEDENLEHKLSPIVVAEFFLNLALAYGRLGNYKKEAEFASSSLELRKEVYGSESIQVAYAATYIGKARCMSDQYEESLEHFQIALSIHERVDGFDSLDVAICSQNLGNALGALELYGKQVELNERALEIFEKETGEASLEVGMTSVCLGIAYMKRQKNLDLEESLEHLERASRILEKELGGNHVVVAICILNQALVHKRLKERERYVECLEIMLKILQEALPKDDQRIEVAENALQNARKEANADDEGSEEPYDKSQEKEDSPTKILQSGLNDDFIDMIFGNSSDRSYRSKVESNPEILSADEIAPEYEHHSDSDVEDDSDGIDPRLFMLNDGKGKIKTAIVGEKQTPLELDTKVVPMSMKGVMTMAAMAAGKPLTNIEEAVQAQERRLRSSFSIKNSTPNANVHVLEMKAGKEYGLLKFEEQSVSLPLAKSDLKITAETHTTMLPAFLYGEDLFSDFTTLKVAKNVSDDGETTYLDPPAKISVSVPNIDQYANIFVAMFTADDVHMPPARIENDHVNFWVKEDAAYFIWGSNDPRCDVVIATRSDRCYIAAYTREGVGNMSAREVFEINDLRKRALEENSKFGRIIENIVLPQRFSAIFYKENGDVVTIDALDMKNGYVYQQVPVEKMNYLFTVRLWRSQSFASVLKAINFSSSEKGVPLSDLLYLREPPPDYEPRFQCGVTARGGCHDHFHFRLRRGARPWGCVVSHSHKTTQLSGGEKGCMLIACYNSDVEVMNGHLMRTPVTRGIWRYMCRGCGKTVFMMFDNDSSYYFFFGAIKDNELIFPTRVEDVFSQEREETPKEYLKYIRREATFSEDDLQRIQQANENTLIARIFTRYIPPDVKQPKPHIHTWFKEAIPAKDKPSQVFMERFAYLSLNVPIELLERENLWLLKSLSNTKGPAFTNYEDDLREERRREKEYQLEAHYCRLTVCSVS